MANAVIKRCIPEQVTRHGAVIMLNSNDPVVSGALTFGVYEKPETAFLLSVFRPGMTFLDVGANLGYYTALAITRLGKEGKIIALEPDVENFGFLQKTVRANLKVQSKLNGTANFPMIRSRNRCPDYGSIWFR